VKEAEIRPQNLLDRYMELSARDGAELNKDFFKTIPCPGCGEQNSDLKFKKNGFSYQSCKSCFSLYCSPRPSSEQLSGLYSESESSTYWSQVFFPAVQEPRREKLFRPKAKKIAKLIQDKGIRVGKICDVGAGHGLFLEELRSELSEEMSLFAIEPDGTSSKILRDKGFEVLRALVEESSEWAGKFDFIICSEVIEHVFDANQFLASLSRLLAPGGYCLVTGLGCEGYDVLTLGEHSKAVSPPHHLNFLSHQGFEKAFKRNGFSSVSIETPGKLDLDIVLNSKTPSDFAEAIQRRGSEAMEAFQSFLQEFNLSSHVWVLAQK